MSCYDSSAGPQLQILEDQISSTYKYNNKVNYYIKYTLLVKHFYTTTDTYVQTKKFLLLVKQALFLVYFYNTFLVSALFYVLYFKIYLFIYYIQREEKVKREKVNKKNQIFFSSLSSSVYQSLIETKLELLKTF